MFHDFFLLGCVLEGVLQELICQFRCGGGGSCCVNEGEVYPLGPGFFLRLAGRARFDFGSFEVVEFS